MTAIYWLMAANAAFWAGMGCYVLFLGNTQKKLERRIQQWEMDHD